MTGKLPELPLDALGPTVGPFVRAVATAYQVPPELPALGALATLSATALKRVRVRVRPGWTEHLALYVAPVLEPGERKTAALGAVAGPLRDFERARQAEALPLVRESERAHGDAQARVRHLSDKVAKAAKDGDKLAAALDEARAKLDGLGPRLYLPRWFVDDATPEALTRCMAENEGRMALFSSEGGIFETLAGRYANGVPNLDLLLKGWDGAEPYHYDRVGTHLHLAEPLLAVCLFVQPQVLAGLAEKPGFRSRGLIGRFLYAVPESRLGARDVDPPPVPIGLGLAWRGIVERVASLPDRRDDATGELQPRLLSIEPEALVVLLDYAREIEPRLGPEDDLRSYSDWVGKHVGTCARIAGLLHLADAVGNEDRPIPVETVRRAIALGRVLVAHAVAAIDLMAGGKAGETREQREARELVEHVEVDPGCTASDVAQGSLRRYRGRPEKATQDLDALSGDGRPLIREPGPRTVRYYAREGWRGMNSAPDGAVKGGSDAKPQEHDAEEHPFGTGECHPFGAPPPAEEGGAPWQPL